MEMEEIARWAYIAFVVIAIVMGLAIGYMAYDKRGIGDPEPYLGTSITAKEVTPFLIATIALIVATVANVWTPLANIEPLLYYWATGILNYIVAFAAPAAVIIAIKSVFAMAKD